MAQIEGALLLLALASVSLFGVFQKLRAGNAPWRRPLIYPDSEWDAQSDAQPDAFSDDRFLAGRKSHSGMFWTSVGINFFFAALLIVGAMLMLFGVIPVR